MPTTSPNGEYRDNLSCIEKATLAFTMFIHIRASIRSLKEQNVWNLNSFSLALVLLWTFLKTLIFPHRTKTLSRVIIEKSCAFATAHMSDKQIRWVSGSTRRTYEKWTKNNGHPFIVDELGENARLFWVGPHKAERVILFIHGMYYLP